MILPRLIAALSPQRRPVTEGQQETARETRVALELMAEANEAGSDMSDEQRIFLADSLAGMRRRESVLLGVANRSVVEETELQMIRREMARIEGRPAPAQPRVRGFFGAAPAALGLLGGFRPWMAWAGAILVLFGWGAWERAQGQRFKAERNEARVELAQTERSLVEARANAAAMADAVRAADAQTRETADLIEQERARRARAEREARRIRDAMAAASRGEPVDYGFGSVRDAGAADGSAGPDRGDATGARPR